MPYLNEHLDLLLSQCYEAVHNARVMSAAPKALNLAVVLTLES